jgi:hypothetical protein
MRKCLFCANAADSHEHVLPQWLHRRIAAKGKFPVQVGRYVEGEGFLDKRKFVSLNFKARIVCTSCNNGWMSKMESEVEQMLRPLTEKQFPVLAHAHLEQLREHRLSIARWMAKTALTTSYALPGNQRLASELADKIAQGRPPHGAWVDVAKAKVSGIAAGLTKMFPTINGNRFVGPQTHQNGRCFQFSIQINQLLLRVGMSPGAEVGYIAHGGLNPFRLFPDADHRVPENIEFEDVNHFLHSVVLRTWSGCPGEVPSVRV